MAKVEKLLLRPALSYEEQRTIEECIDNMFNEILEYYETSEFKVFAHEVIARNLTPIENISERVGLDYVTDCITGLLEKKLNKIISNL